MVSDIRRDDNGAGAARSQLCSKVAELSEAECGEVIEYIEVMRSLRRDAADRALFDGGFARRVTEMREGGRPAHRAAAS